MRINTNAGQQATGNRRTGLVRPLIPRALRIMDALVKALDTAEYEFKFKEQYSLGSFVLIEGQSVQFSLDEAIQRIGVVRPSDKRSWLIGSNIALQESFGSGSRWTLWRQIRRVHRLRDNWIRSIAGTF